VAKKSSCSLKRYSNGSTDKSVGPIDASQFPGGKDDQRFKKQVEHDKALKRNGFVK